MIILGRECGLAIDMQQVTVQSLVPPQLTDTQSADDFMTQLPQVCPALSLQHHSSLCMCQVLLKHDPCLLDVSDRFGCCYGAV